MKFVLILFILTCQTGSAQTLPKRPKLANLRNYNQSRLMNVTIGMSRQQVLDTMGGIQTVRIFDPNQPLGFKKTAGIPNPYSRDIKKDSTGNTIEILWYYTNSTDKEISKKDLSPIVLENNSVVGVGWGFFEDYAKRKEVFFDISNH
jgi:hypothetical protein